MTKQQPNPIHQPETKWVGGVFFFEGTGLSPDDPEFKRRARLGRSVKVASKPARKKRDGRKPKK